MIVNFLQWFKIKMFLVFLYLKYFYEPISTPRKKFTRAPVDFLPNYCHDLQKQL